MAQVTIYINGNLEERIKVVGNVQYLRQKITHHEAYE